MAGFTPMESRPVFYRDERFRKRMEWSFLPAIGFVLGLVNINLKYTLLIGGTAILLSNWVLRPVAETLIVEPLFAAMRRETGMENDKTAKTLDKPRRKSAQPAAESPDEETGSGS